MKHDGIEYIVNEQHSVVFHTNHKVDFSFPDISAIFDKNGGVGANLYPYASTFLSDCVLQNPLKNFD